MERVAKSVVMVTLALISSIKQVVTVKLAMAQKVSTMLSLERLAQTVLVTKKKIKILMNVLVVLMNSGTKLIHCVKRNLSMTTNQREFLKLKPS
jgi:hypothetical protein